MTIPAFIQGEMSREDRARVEADLLGKLSRAGLAAKLAAHRSEAFGYESRLAAELKVIADKQYAGYFLIVADYVRWAKDNDIAVGPGRGSGPCSLTAYALGITHIDPLEHKLPFERFINPLRNTHADFDLDFCEARRDEIITYLQSKYGADHVALISSEDATPLASRLVICDRPVADAVALYSHPESVFPVANITRAQLAGAGLVQFNALNQSALTVIQHAGRQIQQSTAARIPDINTAPLDDESTFKLLCSGERSNISSLDCSLDKAALLEVQPDCFADLCALIALSFWKSASLTKRYTVLKQNPALIESLHPALLEFTAETHGLILYQEQIMHIAHSVAGLDFGQSDMLRRSLRRFDHDAIAAFRQQFTDGAVSRGLSDSEAARIFEAIAESGQHVFNKSHAIAYATLTYQAVWLRANFPAEYNSVRAVMG